MQICSREDIKQVLHCLKLVIQVSSSVEKLFGATYTHSKMIKTLPLNPSSLRTSWYSSSLGLGAIDVAGRSLTHWLDHLNFPG